MNDLRRLRRRQRRTAIAAGFRGIVKGTPLILLKKTMRVKAPQTAGMRRLGGKCFQQRLEGAERNKNQ
jgi:hypothetical protein